MLKQLATCCLAAPLLFTPAVAQTRFCLGGDLEHLSAAQRSACSNTLQSVRQAATALQVPSEWHFVVVCSEDGWKQYTAFLGTDGSDLERASAHTELGQHETYLRERDLETQGHAALLQIMTRELAVIQLHSKEGTAAQASVIKASEQVRFAQAI